MKHARADYNRIQDPENLIPEDEPVFLIRAKDMVGPKAVRLWAALAKQAGADREIVAHALAHAVEMEKYQKLHGHKVPDMPKQERTSKFYVF